MDANKNMRTPNVTEQFIIKQVVKNIYSTNIGIFILFAILGATLLYLTFIGFKQSILIPLMMLLLDIAMLIFLFATGLFLSGAKKILQNKDFSSYKIHSDHGEWSIEFEGASAKTRHPVSKVNGDKITMVFPEKDSVLKYDEIRSIEYEYVEIFEIPPVFGYSKIFISINGKKFTEKHKNYIQNIKPIGILSLVASITFCVILCFCFAIQFESVWMLYICLVLSVIFFRTIIILRNNYQLRKKFKVEI